MSKKLVYISGALTVGGNIESLKNFYEEIGEVCEQAGYEVYIPHKHTDPVKHPNVTPETVYQKDMEQVEKSDLIIAYIGLPSLGVGAEIERAYHSKVKVILLYQEAEKVSRLVRGCPAIQEIIVYKTEEEALHKLKASLS